MKSWKKNPNFIKAICSMLAGTLAVSSVVVFGGNELEVSAAKNTLPGIEQLREDYINNTKTYRILEVVPELENAEIGYYIGGQEPFALLYDKESGVYGTWQERLLELEEKAAREEFMKALLIEAAKVNAYYEPAGIVPFTIAEYAECSADTEGATELKVDGEAKRGYLEYSFGEADEESGEWDATFLVLEDRDTSLDAINGSVTTPYYKAMNVESPFTYQELEAFALDYPAEDIYIMRPEGYLEYVGAAQQVWEETAGSAEYMLFSISGNDVSGGDVMLLDAEEEEEETTNFYHPYFALVDAENPVVAGEQVYLMKEAEYVGSSGGHYALVETVEREKPGESFFYNATYLYFTGGITNNEVFKQEVFGLEAADCSRFRVEVETVTPSILNRLFVDKKVTTTLEGAGLLADYDMVYIHGGAATNAIFGYTGAFSAENDFSSRVMGALGLYISVEKIPCIFDLEPFVMLNEYGGYSLKTYEIAATDGTATAINLNETNLARLAYFFSNPSYEASGNDIAGDLYYASLEMLVYNTLPGLDTNNSSNETCFGSQWKELGNRYEKTDDAVESRDISFVKDNVWFVCNEPAVTGNGTLRNRGLFSGQEYALEQIKAGFLGVYQEILVENMYLAEQGETPLETRIYDASVFRYIVNFSSQRQMSKESLDVLVIEPAGRESSFDREAFASYTGVDVNQITFHVMAINEFVGRIEDLSATYDVVYFDANTSGLVTENGVTVYNDEAMNGLLYSHVGDTVEAFASISGLLDTDYTGDDRTSGTLKETTVHRYSGNDLTVEKYNELKDYLAANYPIVIASELVTTRGDAVQVINSDRVDNSSYLYEFLSEILADENQKNIFISGELSEKQAAFSFYANRPKLSLYSPEYEDLIMTRESYQLADGTTNERVTQITPIEGHYYLQFDFIIENDSAANFGNDYTCRLYLDANADGKFSEEYEELILTGANIVDVTTGASVSSTEELKAGVRYQVSREIPDSFHGCITWQLEVAMKDFESIHTVHKGYTKLSGGDAAHIKVLQVYYREEERVINLEQSIGHFENGAYDNEGMTYVTNYFKEVAQNISEDYILDIKTISKSVFDSGYYDGVDPIILADYDMLILGFSDGNNVGMDWENGIDSASNLAGIADNNISHFIESGKSVLFAHDMTSTINVSDYNMRIGSSLDDEYRLEANKGVLARQFYYGENAFNEYAWGYNINKKLRNLVGMDTFGISSGGNQSVLSKGKELYQTTAWVAEEEAVVYGTKDDTAVVYAPQKDETTGRYEYGVQDVAFKPKSARETAVSQVQGFTAYALNMRVYADEENVSYYRDGMAPNRSNYYTTQAEKVNDGQITNYPYVISEGPTLAYTHQQYYTLDLNADGDSDGETDVVVWYNLATDAYSIAYGQATGDVKNNYYIYSKGNVIYTGMGHAASITGWKNGSYYEYYKTAVTLEEAKLFINTMIAAYNAGQRNPEIVTMNAGGVATNAVYNYYDALITEYGDVDAYNEVADAEKAELFFRLDDMNITQGTKEAEIHYYLEVDADEAKMAELKNDGYTVLYASQLPDMGGDISSETVLIEVTDYLKDYTYVGKEAAKVQLTEEKLYLQTETVYRVEIPLKYFVAGSQGCRNSFYIGGRTIMTHSSIIDGSKVASYTPYVYAQLQCVNVELFDLD